MKTARQARQEARALSRLCLVNGQLDDARARLVVDQLAASGRTSALTVLKQFVRRMRIEDANRSAVVASAAPLDPEFQSRLERDLARQRGRPIATTYVVDPSLVGGIRVKVGSDVYDGSVRGRLAALESRF
jgi:F-type H+-transporting ATPase subunit delta